MPHASLQEVNDLGNPQSEAAIADSNTLNLWEQEERHMDRRRFKPSQQLCLEKAKHILKSSLESDYLPFPSRDIFNSLSCNWRHIAWMTYADCGTTD